MPEEPSPAPPPKPSPGPGAPVAADPCTSAGGAPGTGVATRLIVALVTLMAAVQLGLAWFLGGIQERQLVDRVAQGGVQLSRSLAEATWHAMLANQREDVYAMMRRVSGRNGIDRIRLFDNEGRLAFETDPAEGPERWEPTAAPCLPCHRPEGTGFHVEPERRTRIVAADDGRRQLGIVTGIHNETACSTAPCHAHPPSRTVLGVLDVTIDLAPVDAELADLRRTTGIVVVAEMAVLGLAILLLTTRLVGRPIRRLVAATRAIARGDLATPVSVEDPTELGALARDFERMREGLAAARADAEEARADLERKVEERTRKLKDAERHLLQADRLASLGRLAGTVAHEINNPISACLNFSTLMERMLRDGRIPPGREEELRGYLGHVSAETARVGRIVSELLAFSRRASPQRVRADLHGVVERTISILRHKFEMSRVEVRFEPGVSVPLVECDPSQIEQVVMNLLGNAAEAMPKGGHVTVRTRFDPVAAEVVIDVEDDGPGIPPEVEARMFEPFFSTKEGGKSLGLGLSVVFGIVDSHHGRIGVTTRVGQGTTFQVRLPLVPPPPPAGGPPVPPAPEGDDP